MAKITSQIAAQKIGNIYDMVLIASTRAREISKGKKPLIDSSNKPSITAIREIEQEKIGREYLRKLRKK